MCRCLGRVGCLSAVVSGCVCVGACVCVCVNKKNQPEKEMHFVPLHGAKKLDFLLPVASKGSKK